MRSGSRVWGGLGGPTVVLASGFVSFFLHETRQSGNSLVFSREWFLGLLWGP